MCDQGPTACGSDLPLVQFLQPFLSGLFRRCEDRSRYGAVRKSVFSFNYVYIHTAVKSGPCLISLHVTHTPNPPPPLPRHDSMNLSTHNISVYSHGTTKSIQLSLRILWKSLTERVVLSILVFWRTFVCRSVAIYHFGLTFLSTEVASMTPQKAVHKILAHFYVFTFVEIWFVADIDSTLKNRFRSGVTSVALLGAWWSQFRSVILSTIL